ncbi:MAG TPA: hypothetical protein VGQ22_14125 [Steroidobacteraceae bacterium]|jgi:hypothetical protein|nr:hypothetical protein [Steroidobacteraceae bacterium]
MTPDPALIPLHEWESFYVIIGTSAAALTGLTFVVIAVVADAGPRAATPLGIATFITPTILHFCAALLISSILSAPWHEHIGVQIALGVSAIVGFVWSLLVWRGTRGKQLNYQMVLEDWVWHVALPLIAYGAVLATAIIFARNTELGLFMVGGASTLLVFIGIHNAWDTVTHLTLQRLRREQEKPDS